jgi:hypothetical protein
MPLTHILVDFENVQPSAADIGLVRGDALRLAIFRGPGQMKYAADVAEAWQPLGANVTFVRCAKAGRNAVDMHIAFYLGELVAAAEHADAANGARFVIVSRDTDFDPLLLHIRGQGYEATRVASIKAALGGHEAEREPRAVKSRTRTAAKTAKAAEHKPAAPKAPPARKATARKTAAKKTAAAPTPPAAKGRSTPLAPAPAGNGATPEARARVIDSLRRMGDKRPAKRTGLARHIESHLGRNLEPGVLDALLGELERDGVLAFSDNKVEYRLPKAKK